MQGYLVLRLVPAAPSNASLFFFSRARRALQRSIRARRTLLSPAIVACGEQNHYAVLGLSRSASAADVKKAYRLLARKYHPDVSSHAQADKVFKSIRLAYEVLSDEDRRSRYDRELKFQDSGMSYGTKWNRQSDLDMDDTRKMHRWDELRQQIRYEYYKRMAEASGRQREDSYEETKVCDRGPFTEVLWFAFSTLFLLLTVGSRLALSFCALASMLDKRLDAGYKMGYMIALILGGQGGILLSLTISFMSWFCGKNNSDAVTLPVLAMWVCVNLSTFASIPQGAMLVLLHMSMKQQV